MKTIAFMCADDPVIAAEGWDGLVSIVGLCRRPSLIEPHIGGAEQIVLLLHEDAHDLSMVQRALRAAGVDPLGTQILDVMSDTDPGHTGVAVRGLTARAQAFAGSRPEHAKPVVVKEMSRRALLTVPALEYASAPSIDHGMCAARDGCRTCVDVCPQEAYQWSQGRIRYDKDVCEPCGLCVTACPTSAISNPAVTPEMLKAQVTELLIDGTVPTGIRFVCARRLDRTQVQGWHDVEVPCSGMVPGVWLIAVVLMGAGAVAVNLCGESGCSLRLDDHALKATEFAREALTMAGLDPGLAGTHAGEVARAPVARVELHDPFGRSGVVEVLLALDEASAGLESFDHPGSNTGAVEIRGGACTLCLQCAQICPTGALEGAQEENSISLNFDAGACTACNQCLTACPELDRGAITVRPSVDVDLLVGGRRTLNSGAALLCESCGKPVAPSAMMDRVGELLGEDFTATLGYLTRRCMGCRGL
jgi:ferredoxin